jgi:hypothetical protein
MAAVTTALWTKKIIIIISNEYIQWIILMFVNFSLVSINFFPDDPQKLGIVQSICEKPVTKCKRKKAAYYLFYLYTHV